MELAGDVMQDLCSYLAVTELASTADFPGEMAALRALLQRVDEFNANRLKFTAEMADQSQLIKMLVVQGEDARVLEDMRALKSSYAELYGTNNQLLGEFVKRRNNHEALLAALKEVNSAIQKASRLRVGRAKAQVVSGCRAAIKASQTAALIDIICTGQAQERR